MDDEHYSASARPNEPPKQPAAKRRKKLTKRERRQLDPLLPQNIDELLGHARESVLRAHRDRPADRRFRWPLIRLAQSYVREACQLAQKCVHRLSRAVKRTFCRRCRGLFVEGVTCVRCIERRDGLKYLETTCTLCGHRHKLVLRAGLRGTRPSHPSGFQNALAARCKRKRRRGPKKLHQRIQDSRQPDHQSASDTACTPITSNIDSCSANQGSPFPV